MENKHTQQVDFSNPNADKINSGTTNKPLGNKQTAVDWLIEQLNPDMKTMQGNIIQDLLEQAKEIERKQIEDAFGKERIIVNGEGFFKILNSKQYYNQYYKQEIEKL